MRRAQDSRLAIAVCALLFLGGLAGVVLVWGAWLSDSRLLASGPRAEAQVVRKEFLRSADGDSDYILHYRFTPAAGPTLVVQRNVPRGLWDSMREGSSIRVVYSPDDPRRSFPEGAGVTSPWVPIVGSLVFGALAALGGSILFGLAFRPSTGDRS